MAGLHQPFRRGNPADTDVGNQKDIFQFRAINHCAKRTTFVGLPLSEQGGVLTPINLLNKTELF